MNILMVTPFYPPDVGGIAYHVSNLVKQLSKAHDVTVAKNDICRGISRDNNIKITKILSVIPPPYPFEALSSFRIPLALHSLFNLIYHGDFDIIHMHGHHYPITWLAASMANIKNIPSVITIHGMYALTWHPTQIEEAFNNSIVKKLLSTVDGIVSITPTVDDFIRKYETNGAKHFIIPSGIDLQIYRRNINKKLKYRDEYGLPRDKLIILYRGRFVDVKGVLELAIAVENLNDVPEIRNKVHFVLCGEGALKDKVLDHVKDIPNCSIFGWTDASKVHELYIASDAYILPVKWEEGLGITILEAMAANLHILTTSKGGIADVLMGYPWKTHIEDSSSKCISDSLKDYVKEETITRSPTDIKTAKYHIEKFDWPNIVDQVEKAYQTVIYGE